MSSQLADSESISLSFDASSPPEQVARELASIVKFMQEDTDHVVFRRFEKLNLYNLLWLQHRLVALDKEIAVLETKWDGSELAKVLPQLEAPLKAYYAAVIDQDKMRKIQSAPEYVIASLQAHARDCLKPLQHELHSPESWLDLLSLASREKGWISKVVDRHNSLSRIFRKDKTNDSNSGLYTYSDRAVQIVEQTIVNTAFCILILVPIFALSFITSKIGKLLLVLACVLLASWVASVLADHAQKSNLALVAGYTAILVVFLSNNS